MPTHLNLNSWTVLQPEKQHGHQRVYIGCMTGTSVDKQADFTAALFDQEGLPIAYHNMAYILPDSLREALLAIDVASLSIKQENTITAELTDFLATCYNTYIESLELTHLPRHQVVLSPHGQTILHQPFADPPISKQLLNPSLLSQLTGYPVAHSHRPACLPVSSAAPLAPILLKKLFYDKNVNTFILNGGGIANICWLPANPVAPVIGFDTGPANGPIDDIVRHVIQHDPDNIPNKLKTDIILQGCDVNGDWSKSGDPQSEIVNNLLAHPYFKQPLQLKSADRATFNIDWVLSACKDNTYHWNDILHSTSEAIAISIANAIISLATTQQEHVQNRLLIYGGISHNCFITERIKEKLQAYSFAFQTMSDVGYHADFIESLLMAYLGFCIDKRKAIDLSYCARKGIDDAKVIPGQLTGLTA